LDKTLDVRSIPFEVTFRMICGPDIRVEEEFAGVSVGPVLWDCELGLSGFYSCDEFFKCAVFAD
jgi:hypothetical protein